MKWLIASDLHGSAYYCRKLMEVFEHEKADRMLLLGDLLYHGPRNDLPKEYNPKQVIEILNEKAKSILCVRGNCEAEVDQMVLTFPVLADYAILEECGHVIFATHGHHFNIDALPPLQNGDILLHGHTHVPGIESKNGITVLNPGSLAIPKQNSPHSYMTLENGKFVWKDLETETPYLEFEIK